VALLIGGGAYWYLKRPPAQEPTAASGGGHRVTLGMSAALTGPAKELGRQMKLGIDTALHVANEAGGIHGQTFELVALDDGYEPARTREAMRELVEQRKVFGVIGNVGTPTAEVAVPYANERGILFFGAFTGASLLRKSPPDRFVFNFRASYAEETADVVRYLIDIRRLKPEQIAVFAQQDGFGDAGFAGVAKALRKYGRSQEQILRVGFKRNTLEIGEAVAQILAQRQNLRAVVTVAPYRPAAKFIEEIRKAGLDLAITNVSFVGSTALAEELRQLGPRFCDGNIVTQVVPPTDSSSTAVIRYREALAKSFPGERPDFVSLEGYLAANLLLEGFRRAGPAPTTDSVIGALEQIQNFEMGIGAPLSFGPSEHQASHKVWGTVLDEACNYQVLDME
jgi:ABC-type branched-subunit amino acid transport system substrate-binding protein